MSNSPAGGSRVRVLGLLIGLVALVTAFALASFASGAADPVKSGSATLSLKAKGLKFSPKSPKLTATGGSVDPTNMSGNATVTGKTTAKHGREKHKVTFTNVSLTGSGKGSIDVKVDKKKVKKCLTFTGGKTGRSGFDGTLSSAKMKLSKKCAKKLHGKKGKAGSLKTLTTSPTTETLTGGTATLAFDSTALARLSSKGIMPNGGAPAAPCTEPTATSARCNVGLTAVAPATVDSASKFTLPVTGGTLAPDGSSGQVKVGGGLLLKKVNSSCDANTGGMIQVNGGAACNVADSGAPSGRSSHARLVQVGAPTTYTACNDNQSQIAITNIIFDASSKVVLADAAITVPIAPSNDQTLPNAPLSTITTFSATSNATARTITADAALVNTSAGAGAENKVFGSKDTTALTGGPCGDTTNDFAPNDTDQTPHPVGLAVLSVQGQ